MWYTGSRGAAKRFPERTEQKMNEMIRMLTERRSCRAFEARQVEPELLREVLTAGSYAPSGMNRQSPVMLVMQDGERIRELAALNAAVMGRDGDPFYGAPTVISVLADTACMTWQEDGALVIGNLLVAAHALGLAGCWIHRAREVFDSERGRAILREYGIPDSCRGVGHCILGYREGESPEAKPRREGRIFGF